MDRDTARRIIAQLAHESVHEGFSLRIRGELEQITAEHPDTRGHFTQVRERQLASERNPRPLQGSFFGGPSPDGGLEVIETRPMTFLGRRRQGGRVIPTTNSPYYVDSL